MTVTAACRARPPSFHMLLRENAIDNPLPPNHTDILYYHQFIYLIVRTHGLHIRLVKWMFAGVSYNYSGFLTLVYLGNYIDIPLAEKVHHALPYVFGARRSRRGDVYYAHHLRVLRLFSSVVSM